MEREGEEGKEAADHYNQDETIKQRRRRVARTHKYLRRGLINNVKTMNKGDKAARPRLDNRKGWTCGCGQAIRHDGESLGPCEWANTAVHISTGANMENTSQKFYIHTNVHANFELPTLKWCEHSAWEFKILISLVIYKLFKSEWKWPTFWPTKRL